MTRPRPLPRVEIEVGRSLPGWALRVAAVLAVGMTPLLAAQTAAIEPGLRAFFAVAAGVLAVLTAWRPSHGPALFGAALTAILVGLSSPDGGLPPGVWLAPLAYVGLRLSLWTAATGLTARVELAALRRSARADGVVVGVTVLLGGVASLLSGASFAGLAIGAGALLALVLLVLRTQDGTP